VTLIEIAKIYTDLFKAENKIPEEEYIQLWKEFLPVIALEIGYAFGKRS
jgi:hypothetical protein